MSSSSNIDTRVCCYFGLFKLSICMCVCVSYPAPVSVCGGYTACVPCSLGAPSAERGAGWGRCGLKSWRRLSAEDTQRSEVRGDGVRDREIMCRAVTDIWTTGQIHRCWAGNMFQVISNRSVRFTQSVSQRILTASVCRQVLLQTWQVKLVYTMVWVYTGFWLAAGSPLKTDNGHLVLVKLSVYCSKFMHRPHNSISVCNLITVHFQHWE